MIVTYWGHHRQCEHTTPNGNGTRLQCTRIGPHFLRTHRYTRDQLALRIRLARSANYGRGPVHGKT